MTVYLTFIKILPPGGSGEASGIYTLLSPTFSRRLPPRLGVSLMSSPSFPALQQLYHLNGSSSGFHDRLKDVLYGEEYRQCVQNLQRDDLVWLVNYLDNVRRRIALPCSLLHLA